MHTMADGRKVVGIAGQTQTLGSRAHVQYTTSQGLLTGGRPVGQTDINGVDETHHTLYRGQSTHTVLAEGCGLCGRSIAGMPGSVRSY